MNRILALIERKRLLIAGLDVRPRDIAIEGAMPEEPLKLLMVDVLLTRTAEHVKGAYRTQAGCATYQVSARTSTVAVALFGLSLCGCPGADQGGSSAPNPSLRRDTIVRMLPPLLGCRN